MAKKKSAVAAGGRIDNSDQKMKALQMAMEHTKQQLIQEKTMPTLFSVE